MPSYIVATVDEIPPGGRKIVEVAGRSLGIFNVAGEYYALRNRCPHQGGPLCTGVLTGFVESSAPGVYRYTRSGEILRCPWHGWEFDVTTGQSWFDPSGMRVRRYPVRIAAGDAVGNQKTACGGLRPGPYVAETYPVSVERQYVLVTVNGVADAGAGAG
jgi:3-phenylpropionate/trans-cinnamate dioxygenase ferredoxin subunit